MSGLDDRTEKLIELGREVLLGVVETSECLNCEGRGEVYAGYRDPETNAPVGVRCTACEGLGRVDFEQVECDMCSQVFPLDQECPHRSAVLCPACSTDVCGECRSAYRAEVGYDAEPWWVAS